MPKVQKLIYEYGISHLHPVNIIIHKICVPLIMFSLLGLLWCIPFPTNHNPLLNWATFISLLCILYYFRFGLKVALFMIFKGFIFLSIVFLISKTNYLLFVSSTIFVFAWIAQFIGHKIEGKKPSFFEDLQFLLIGPLWIFPFFKKSRSS